MGNLTVGFVSFGVLSRFTTTYRALGLAKGLFRHGYSPILFIPGFKENRELYSDSYYEFLKTSFCQPKFETLSKYQKLCEVSPDIVHCIALSKRNFIPSLLYHIEKKRPLIVDLDEDFASVHKLPRKLYSFAVQNWFIRAADRIIVVSKALYEMFVRKINADRVVYLPYATDVELFNHRKKGWQKLKEKWGPRVVLTYMGHFNPWHDGDMVLKVAKCVVSERRDVLFLMIGSGAMESIYRDYVSKNDLEDFVKFTGYIPDTDLPKYLCASDVLLFPIRDNWPNRARCPGKTYIYLASERPIVTNPVGEVKETLDGYAYFFDHFSLSDFASKILLAIEKVSKVTPQEARERISQNSWEARANIYVKKVIQNMV